MNTAATIQLRVALRRDKPVAATADPLWNSILAAVACLSWTGPAEVPCAPASVNSANPPCPTVAAGVYLTRWLSAESTAAEEGRNVRIGSNAREGRPSGLLTHITPKLILCYASTLIVTHAFAAATYCDRTARRRWTGAMRDGQSDVRSNQWDGDNV